MGYLVRKADAFLREWKQNPDRNPLIIKGARQVGKTEARYEVVAVLGYHLVETRNLVGRVLQVGVHGDDHVAFCLFETAE